MTLLRWALALFVISLIAALFGFTGIAEGSAEIAKFLFFVFVVGLVLLLILAAFVGRSVTGGP